MVRVLVIADEEAPNLHARTLRDLAPGLILAAGDLPWDYLEFVASCVDAPMVFVPGNHDPALRPARWSPFAVYDADGVSDHDPRPHGATNADQSVIEAAGLRIAGLGGCVRYKPGPHQYTQSQYDGRARRLLRRARRGGPVDILLTHAPPFGLGDGEDRPHEGIRALHSVIDRLEPSWHLHGHVHPYGQVMPDRHVGATTITNVIPWKVLDVTPRSSLAEAAAP
ncbi:MAG: metallophosphoesterase [Marmoricola sp.]